MFYKNGKLIIVSADDFGISQVANEKILELVHKNKIDRVEIMISENFKPEQIQSLLVSDAKLDIHLHLAKDKIDQWQNSPRLIDSGVVKRILSFLYNYFLGKGVPEKVEREWERQLIEFKKTFGRVPDGASSHEHIHFFSSYFKVLLKLCDKHGIGYIRLGKLPFKIKTSKVSVILNWLKERNQAEFKKHQIDTSDLMVSFDWIKDFDGFLNTFPKDKVIEIVFHPEIKKEFEFLEKF
jgi:predicted glycoside hydrolase/deacetylase ChbG (UPF0249 family)